MGFKNILITGGAGFIGSHLAIDLTSRGYNVTVLDNLSVQIHGNNPNDSPIFRSIKGTVDFINGDVRSRSDWEKALIDQDVVVHLAAETGTGQSMYEVEKYVDVNIKGTSILFDVLANKELSVKKLVVASSRSIYGEGKYRCKHHGDVYPESRLEMNMEKGDFEVKCPFCLQNVSLLSTDEQSKIHPSSLYGLTKHNQEQMFLVMGKALDIPAVAFRYQNVYGPGQSLKNPYTGILSIFSNQIRSGFDLNIFEDGLESRDFVYIDDVVEATVKGIEKPEANYKVFNVGTGIPVNVLTVANTLKALYGAKVEIEVSGNYRIGDIRHNYADLTHIQNCLGFQPQFTFQEGIDKLVRWVSNQGMQQSDYSKSIEELKERGLYK